MLASTVSATMRGPDAAQKFRSNSRRAVDRRVAPGHLHGDRVDVACTDAPRTEPVGGDGEDAAAGADVGHGPERPALRDALQRDEAAARRGVVRRAEGASCVDHEVPARRRHPCRVVRAEDREASGAHRMEGPLALGHPVPVREGVLDERRQDRDELARRLEPARPARRVAFHEQDVEAPWPVLDGAVGRQDRLALVDQRIQRRERPSCRLLQRVARAERRHSARHHRRPPRPLVAPRRPHHKRARPRDGSNGAAPGFCARSLTGDPR